MPILMTAIFTLLKTSQKARSLVSTGKPFGKCDCFLKTYIFLTELIVGLIFCSQCYCSSIMFWKTACQLWLDMSPLSILSLHIHFIILSYNFLKVAHRKFHYLFSYVRICDSLSASSVIIYDSNY